MIRVGWQNEAVELRLDEKGIDELTATLQQMKGMTTHVHMMTPAWGGKELVEGGEQTVHHLIVYSEGDVS
jgi:hypothetical protein